MFRKKSVKMTQAKQATPAKKAKQALQATQKVLQFKKVPKVQFSLRSVHGDEHVTVRSRITVQVSDLKMVYAFFTKTNGDSIRLVYKTKDRPNSETVAEMELKDGDFIDVYKVSNVVDYPNYELWVLDDNK